MSVCASRVYIVNVFNMYNIWWKLSFCLISVDLI